MTDRLRRFALVSLLGLIAASAALLLFYRDLARTGLLEHQRSHNEVLSRMLARTLEDHRLGEILDPPSGLAMNALRERPEIALLDNAVKRLTRGLKVAKIKLYNRDGLTVYSTQLAQVGEDGSARTAVRAALAGAVSGRLIHRDSFDPDDGAIDGEDLFESYMPVRDGDDGTVRGVFELYSDVTAALARQRATEHRILAGVVAILGGFYLVLFVLFRNADRALRREQTTRDRSLRRLEGARYALEGRVSRRTRELESSRFFLQSVIDGIASPLLVIGTDLKVMLRNRAASALLPATAAEAAHCYQLWRGRSTPCDGPEQPCTFAEVLETGSTARVLHTHRGADGDTRIVEVTSTPLRDQSGEFIGVIEVEHDVTELMRARDRINESEERMRAVMDTVVDAIVTVDAEGRIEDANLAAEQLFGNSRATLIGRSLLYFIEEYAEMAAPRPAPVDYLRPRVVQGSRESVLIRADGSRMPVEFWVGEAHLAGRDKFIAVMQDVSDRKRAEQELEQTRQQYFHKEKMAAIGQLAAGILHEVGNPIAAIAGSINAIREAERQAHCAEPCPLRQQGGHHMTMIEEQVNRLASITREIADFASPRPSECELLDLNALIRSTASLLRYDKRLHNVDLRLDLDRTLPAIMGIADQFTQVFMNLVLNAVDACDGLQGRQAIIEVLTGRDGGEVHLVVRDNGAGMDEVTRLRAIDAFFTTKPAGKGTGLGLSLCNSIVSGHNGRMTLESTPGEGTVVHVYVPVEELVV